MSVLDVLELQSGDRMTAAEFHRIYERMPESFRAELIGGIVYVTSPLRRRHHGDFVGALQARRGSA